MTANSVRVVGLNKVVRSLTKAGIEVTDLKAAFKRIAAVVKTEAQGNVHTKTGALAASIREGNSKNKAIVRAGSAKVPYAGVNNYGGYNNITASEFLTGAAKTKEGESVSLLEQEIGQLLQRLDLN